MKIRFSTLLYKIAVFLHFCELNALGEEGASLSKPKRKRNHEPLDCPETKGKPHETITYQDRTGHNTKIELWLDSTRTDVLKADFPFNYVPPPGHYKDNNFYIRLFHVWRWAAVGYFRPTGLLFAVRAPNPYARSTVLEPTRSTWFIVFSRYKFMVTEDPQKEKVEAIHLWPINLHQDPENRNRVKPEKVTFAGVSFIIYKAAEGSILGAHLDPDVHTP